jgi:hypothetical protein
MTVALPFVGSIGQQSAWVNGPARDTIKGAVAIKRDTGEAIETSIPYQGWGLCCDVNQPESPAAVRIITTGRAIKKGIRRGDNIDHASHADGAMREAEVIIGASLVKGVLVHRPKVGKDSLIAVRIVRGTKLFIGRARIAAGDTVAVLGPGPPHRVAHRDVECVWHKHIPALSHRYIEDLASTRWRSAYGGPSVLIHNVNGMGGSLFLVRCADVFVTRSSLRQKYRRKRGCQQKGDS